MVHLLAQPAVWCSDLLVQLAIITYKVQFCIYKVLLSLAPILYVHEFRIQVRICNMKNKISRYNFPTIVVCYRLGTGIGSFIADAIPGS